MVTIRGIPFDANEVILPDGSAGYDNIIYSADFAEWLGTYFKNGVLVPGGAMITTQLKVTNPDTSHLKIDKGNMVVNGRTAFVPEPVTIETTASAPSVERWDRVIVELNLEENINAFVLKVVTGTESATPEAPALVRTDEIYQMSLGTVKHNNSGIYEITDDRAVESLCGISQVLIGVKPFESETVKNFTATISTTGWVGTDAPFILDLIMSEILSSDNPIIDVVLSSVYDTAQKQLKAWGNIYRIVAGSGKLTCYSNEKPEIAIPIQVKVVR